MKDLITQIVSELVDDPESVEVNEVKGDQVTLLEVRVAKDDIGKVIGKEGRTAKAMRRILSGISAKRRHRYLLQIVEDEN